MREDVALSLRQDISLFYHATSQAEAGEAESLRAQKEKDLEELGNRIDQDNKDMEMLFDWIQPDWGFSEVRLFLSFTSFS